MNRLDRELKAGLGRRLQAAYEASRRRWRAANPDRKFAITPEAIYLAPVELRPVLPADREGGG